MKLEGIDHVAVGVRDVEQSAKWYIEVLGFERLHDGVWNGVPTFVGKGNTGIALFPASPDAKSTHSGHRDLRILHLAFRAHFRHLRRGVRRHGCFPEIPRLCSE